MCSILFTEHDDEDSTHYRIRNRREQCTKLPEEAKHDHDQSSRLDHTTTGHLG